MKQLREHIADTIEKHLLDELDLKLSCWGMWWYKENGAELKRMTGQITHNPLAAPTSRVVLPCDDGECDALHRRILAECTRRQNKALFAFYVYHNAPPTNAERLARYKAKRKLAGVGQTNIPHELHQTISHP